MTTPMLYLRLRLLAVALCLSLGLASLPAPASEVLLDLLKILRDKGTLSETEYDMLLAAARADDATGAAARADVSQAVNAAQQEATVARQQGDVARRESNAARQEVDLAPQDAREARHAATAKTDTLAWAEKIKLKGDLRNRYEYINDEGQEDRSRGRFRYRLGVIATPLDRIEVGAGLASGSRDQRSTNQSFGDTFSGKDMNLDYAYMQYASGNGLNGVAGKFSFKNYLWTPSDLMWDTDINPEGLSLNYTANDSFGTVFANGGVWVIEEYAESSEDPYMVYAQAGQNWRHGRWFGTVAATVYGFADINYVSDIDRYDGRNTDSKLSSANLAVDIARPVAAGELHVFGEFIQNVETNTDEDTAWTIGTRYLVGKWNLRYQYADVDLNAVPDFLPDSDRDKGFAGVRGHEVEIQYELRKQIVLGLDFYHVEDTVTHLDEDLLQADLTVKF